MYQLCINEGVKNNAKSPKVMEEKKEKEVLRCSLWNPEQAVQG